MRRRGGRGRLAFVEGTTSVVRALLPRRRALLLELLRLGLPARARRLALGPLLAPGSAGTDAASMEKLNDLLYEWADIALRTLVWGRRELTNYDDWHALYEMACQDPSEVRKHKTGQPSRIGELQAEAEAMLTLQGATAIEDKLQDGVPEVLADLRLAGIKVWMLTGDKVGTAKNIATACNILPQNADVLELTTETYPVLGEISSLKMTEVEHIVERAMTEGAHPEDANKGYVAKCCGNMMRSFGDKAAEEAYREAVAAVIKEQTDKLDAKHPGLKAVRAALAQQTTAASSSSSSQPPAPPPAVAPPSTTPAPCFLASLNTTGVGDIPRLYTSIPFCISAAETFSRIMLPVGLVSLPTTHFPDLIKFAKLLQKLNTSFAEKSFP